jgi:hypothetical protein
MTSLNDAVRRWGPVVERLKARLGRRVTSMAPNVEQAVSETLTTCESLLRDLAASQVENTNLSSQLKDVTSEWVYLFEQMPVACIVTHADATVIQGNRSAAELLNMSPRHLENRLLTHFIEDRQAFSQALQQLSAETADVRGSFSMRPRERAPLMIDAIAVPRTPNDATVWLWFLIPQCAASSTHKSSSRQRTIVKDAAN